jgi:hypothetical protein
MVVDNGGTLAGNVREQTKEEIDNWRTMTALAEPEVTAFQNSTRV